MPVKRVLFLTLNAFSLTGGIEKFNRAFLKAMSDLDKEGKIKAYATSAYDVEADERYFANNRYKGFQGNRVRFVIDVIKSAFKFDTLILSHINLSFAAYIVKKLFPSRQIILVAHGIEVWGELKGFKKKGLQQADKILAVSAFTKQRIVEVHNIDANKISVFHNTLDPYFIFPPAFEKPKYLLERYSLKENDPVVLTLTRLASTEKNKGYDHIINVFASLRERFSSAKYILAGKPDPKEKLRLNNLIEENQLATNVILTGFIKDEEITDHYLLADVFILPSQKEGFGIVFIEAMACGLPVIAGNKDGSVDALQNGALGLLVNPDSEAEILNALQKSLLVKEDRLPASTKHELQQKVIDAFGFDTYKKRLREVLEVL